MEHVSTFVILSEIQYRLAVLHAAHQPRAGNHGPYQPPASLFLSSTLSFPLAYYKPHNASQDEKKGEKASILYIQGLVF